jgi:hypothetical protein
MHRSELQDVPRELWVYFLKTHYMHEPCGDEQYHIMDSMPSQSTCRLFGSMSRSLIQHMISVGLSQNWSPRSISHEYRRRPYLKQGSFVGS